MPGHEDLEAVARTICAERGYDLIQSVGAGAFKVTFHISDRNEDARALKVYNSRNSGTRISREIDAMERCEHPNIAKLDEVDTIAVDGQDFLYSIEQFVGGQTLAQRIETSLLDIDELQDLALSLSEALAHLADRGLVHRDIKPENVILSDEGVPVLIDFGLVRNLDAPSITESWITQGPGTPFYASPEQLTNDKELIDWRSDQFCLAVVLTVAATGSHPFAESDDAPPDIVGKVAARTGPAGWLTESATISAIDSVIRMLEPWPVRRFRRPEDLIYALRGET